MIKSSIKLTNRMTKPRERRVLQWLDKNTRDSQKSVFAAFLFDVQYYEDITEANDFF